jgi:hypothetical protein
MGTLTTKIKEEVTLNGKLYGNEITKTHSGIERVKQTTVQVRASGNDDLFDFALSTYSIGTVAFNKAKYIRITNLDASETLFLNVYLDLGTDEYILFQVPPKRSWILNEDSMEGTGSATTTLDQINAIKAQCSGAGSIQVEIFVGEIA